MKIKFLDLSPIHQDIEDELNEAIQSVVKSNWFIKGSSNQLFESNYSKYINVKKLLDVLMGLMHCI